MAREDVELYAWVLSPTLVRWAPTLEHGNSSVGVHTRAWELYEWVLSPTLEHGNFMHGCCPLH